MEENNTTPVPRKFSMGQMSLAAGLWLLRNWERIIFSITGLILIGCSFHLIYNDKITNAAVVFGLGFLSFIYANLSRFKRFKGLGFEGELWEDKQREAADLIDRLKSVVSIYTHELVLSKVVGGRWVDEVDWEGHWRLYDDLTSQHAALGQKIDFTSLKKRMDDYFLCDLTNQQRWAVSHALTVAKQTAIENASEGLDIHTPQGLELYNARTLLISSLPDTIPELTKKISTINVADSVLKIWTSVSEKLSNDFQIVPQIDQKHLTRLEALSELHKNRPLVITPLLFDWMRERP